MLIPSYFCHSINSLLIAWRGPNQHSAPSATHKIHLNTSSGLLHYRAPSYRWQSLFFPPQVLPVCLIIPSPPCTVTVHTISPIREVTPAESLNYSSGFFQAAPVSVTSGLQLPTVAAVRVPHPSTPLAPLIAQAATNSRSIVSFTFSPFHRDGGGSPWLPGLGCKDGAAASSAAVRLVIEVTCNSSSDTLFFFSPLQTKLLLRVPSRRSADAGKTIVFCLLSSDAAAGCTRPFFFP